MFQWWGSKCTKWCPGLFCPRLSHLTKTNYLKESAQNYQGTFSVKIVSWILTQHIFAAEALNLKTPWKFKFRKGPQPTALQFCYTTHCCLNSAKHTQLTSHHLCMKLSLILIYSLDAVSNCHSYITDGTTGWGWVCCKHVFLNLGHT